MDVLVHGGAGPARVDPAEQASTLGGAHEAAVAESDPVTAVRAAVRHLESAPAFNAGVGGAIQSDGVVRTDAGLMTSGGTCGAACAMPGVEHAIEVARAVGVETPHVLLAGDGALALAAAHGVETDGELTTERTRNRWAAADPPPAAASMTERLAWVRAHFGGTDTVGAVAVGDGSLAAATSTAGRWFALAGRVGDVPQVGAGFYATAAGAASATGEGEAIAQFGLARRAVAALDAGTRPGDAAADVIDAFERATGGRAGVILLDAAGDRGQASNAESFQTAGD